MFECVFIFSLICGSIVQSILVEATCPRIVGSCSVMDCKTHCRNYPGGGAIGSSCSYYNQCTCIFDFPKSQGVQTCSVGLGLCKGICDSNCCNSRCATRYKSYKATGKCFHYLNKKYCICFYETWSAPNPYQLKS